MADEPRYRSVAKLRGHTNGVRRRRPVKQSVRAIRGAGHLRRHPAERPHCVRVVGPHAQGVAKVDRRVPWDAARTRGRRAAPASSRTARRLLVDAARGAGPVRRRAVARRHRVWVARQHNQGVGRVEGSVPPDADRAHGLGAAPASSRHNASIARRRRDGRRFGASPSSRTAALFPRRSTAHSRSG